MMRACVCLILCLVWGVPPIAIGQEGTQIQFEFVIPEGMDYSGDDYEIALSDHISLQYFIGDEQVGAESITFNCIKEEDGILAISQWNIPGVADHEVSEREDLTIYGRVFLRGTADFPFSGRSEQYQEIIVGEINTFRIESRFNHLLLPEHPGFIQLRVMSSLEGIPLPGVVLAMSPGVYRTDRDHLLGVGDFVTDDNGEIRVRVRRINDDLRVGYPLANERAERLHVTVPGEQLLEYATSEEVLEIWTDPKFLQGVRVVHQDEHGEEQLFPYNGYLAGRHPMADDGSGSRSVAVYLRFGLGALYDEGSVFPSLHRLKMGDLSLTQSDTPVRLDMENVRIERDEERGVPIYVIPIASIGPRNLQMAFIDEISGLPIEDVEVQLNYASGGEALLYEGGSNGRVSVADLRWSPMSLTASAPGYQSRDLSLAANENRPRLAGELVDGGIPLIPVSDITVNVDTSLGEAVAEGRVVMYRHKSFAHGQPEQEFYAVAEVTTDADGVITGHRFRFEEIIAGEGVIIFYGPGSELLAVEPISIEGSGALQTKPSLAEDFRVNVVFDSWLSDESKPPRKVVFDVMLIDMATFQVLPQVNVESDGIIQWEYGRYIDALELKLHTRRVTDRIGVIVSRQLTEEPHTNEYAFIGTVDLNEFDVKDVPTITFSHDRVYQWFSNPELIRINLVRSRDKR